MEILSYNSKLISHNGTVTIPQFANSILRKGLEFWIDPSRRDSYPGTGNTVYDLSGNNRYMSLTGAPVGPLSNHWDGKSFSWNSSAEFIFLISQPIIMPDVDGDFPQGRFTEFTYSQWFKMLPTGNSKQPFFIFSTNGPKSFVIDIDDHDSGGGHAGCWTYWNSGGNIGRSIPANCIDGSNAPDSDLANDQWVELTVTWKIGVGIRYFINGSEYLGSFYNWAGDELTTNIPGGRIWVGAAGTMYGKTGSTAVYSRVLTASEILKNYNSLKNNYQ